MRRFLFVILFLFPGTYAENVTAGFCNGFKIYWQNMDIVFDTLCFDTLSFGFGVNTIHKSPERACKSFQEQEKCFFKLTNANALSIAILHDLGYTVLIMNHWIILPQGQIEVYSRNMPGHAKNQKIITDLIWEKLQSYEIEKPVKLVQDYKVKLAFERSGTTEYLGREDILIKQHTMTSKDMFLRLNFMGGDHSMENLKRDVKAIYIYSPKDINVKDIENDVSKKMDELKVDMSYVFPKITKVTMKK